MAMPAIQDGAFVGSMAWIFYRIWQIYKKPVDELVNLLGLDIPPAPEVSLAGITSESVILYLKPPEQQYASLTHSIHINGIKVGEINKGETSVQVTGLKPAHFYSIRVIASSSANFSTLGQLIRLRTLPSVGAKSDGSCIDEANESVEVPENSEAAAVRPAPPQYEPNSVPTMARESSGGATTSKRISSGRRNSPPLLSVEQSASHADYASGFEQDNTPGSVDRLTRRLESLRQEQQDLDRQMQEEDTQSKRSLSELANERDRLRQVLKEREDATTELRKLGRSLDNNHRAAQSRKAQKEQSLNEKKAERQKMQDDIARWERDIIVMRQDIQYVLDQMAKVSTIKDQDALQIRKTIEEEQATVKALEEDIHARGVEIKAMEKEREQLSDGGEEVQQLVKQDMEDDRVWESQRNARQEELTKLWQTNQQLNTTLIRVKDDYNKWVMLHSRDPTQFAQVSGVEHASSVNSNRSRRNKQNSNSRTSTISSPSAAYPPGPSVFGSTSSISPIYSTSMPFFNMGNGTIIPPPNDQPGLTQAETDLISGGGPMSPTAVELLPSNLFRDDDAMARRVSASAGRGSLGSLGSDALAKQVESANPSPRTPVSSSSQFSSPHDSLQNLQSYSSGGDPYTDQDRRSINSTSASFNSPISSEVHPLGTNRFTNLFNNPFVRQRDKTGISDPPQLGTLRQGQSQSFPRNYEQNPDPIGGRQRRGSHGWGDAAMGLLNRRNPGEGGVIRSLTGSGKKSRLNALGQNPDALPPSVFGDQPATARPSSISSFDQIHGRPSNDSQRPPWGPLADNIPTRSSPLGAGWSSGVGGPWTRYPSRRPSVQHGSTSNLSIGSTPLEPEYQGGLSNKASEQLPIGTRPRGGSGHSSQQPITPKLNPAAPSFKTLFGRGGDGRKAAKGEKAPERTKDKDADIEDADSMHEAQSPQNPRLSRDAQSIVTAASISESHESLDRSTSGTGSEVATTSGTKETLMQRISRKGSSSKFNVPWGKERGGFFGRKTGETSTPNTPHSIEFDEDAGSDKHEESPYPVEKTSRTSLSWPNIRRKSKRGGMLAPEAKDTGSEGGEDDD